MAMIYRQGIAPIVTGCGPGTLHHLTYMPASNGGSAVGILPTANEGTTNFLLGFSFNYAGYAFYWDGAGPAFWRAGNSTVKEPVGTSWANATSIPFNKPFVLGVNVQANVAAAGNVGETVTVFFIPEDLD
ncbi:hypothetical protein C8J57DRAFT_1071743 [Mycena rebaudengoi]|jgi:hypothetical protein|nr:hypothetical protein C8J57DRAFT_1090025 [Mycena rebaudengoi]KAJ7261585.1 hypothetical protein C8J57DRAFT_1071743 [Mycena rebaudengoi]